MSIAALISLLGIVGTLIGSIFWLGKDFGDKSVELKDNEDSINLQNAYAKSLDEETTHFNAIANKLRNDASSSVSQASTPSVSGKSHG